MARRRSIEIAESIDELRSELRCATDERLSRAIRILVSIKRDPRISTAMLAEESALGSTTVKRLIRSYREEGLAGFKRRALRVRLGHMTSTPRLLRSNVVPDEIVSSSDRYRKVLRLVREVPSTLDRMEFLAGLRDSLLAILDDVDYLVIRISTREKLSAPSHSVDDVAYTVLHHGDRERESDTIVSEVGPGEDWRRVLEEGKRQRIIDFSQYHRCVGSDLLYAHDGGVTSVASLLLFADITGPPISDATISFVREIEPVLVLVITRYIARLQNHHIALAGFEDLYREVDPEGKLTSQERRILMLHFVGCDSREIAEQVCVDIKTVEAHTGSILRKAGMTSIKKLIAKATSPRVSFSPRPEEGP